MVRRDIRTEFGSGLLECYQATVMTVLLERMGYLRLRTALMTYGHRLTLTKALRGHG